MYRRCKFELVALVLFAGTAWAGGGTQVASVVPSQSSASDNFGTSVSIDGDNLIVGAPGIQQAFLFDVSDFTNPGETVVYSGGSLQGLYGVGVSLSGQNVVIGDYGGVSKNIEFPGVSFYTTSSSSLLHKTFDIASQTDLGRSISINNTTVVAGAPRGEIGPNRPGNARLIDVNTHAESLISPPPSVGPDANFGNSVSLSSQYLAAGVPDYYNGFECVGSVEIFDNNGSFLRKITADLSDQNNFDSFGYSVAVSDTNNTVVLVGAPYDDQAGSDAGAAYLFDLATGNLLFKLVPSDVQSKDLFGWSVEITHNYAIIGSPDNDENGSNSGAVYVYDIGSGQFLYKMLESGGSSANRYGYSISADGYKLAIGASGGNTDLGGFNRGKAFLVDLRCNPADFAAPYGSLNFFDSSAFLAAFNSDDPDADLNGDGTWNFLDISMFTQLLSAGCN